MYSDVQNDYKKIFPFVENPNGIAKNPIWYGCFLENVLIGFCTIYTDDNSNVFLYNFAIKEKYRGNNYGKDFMNLLKQKYDSMFLFCKKNMVNYYKLFNFKNNKTYIPHFGHICMKYIKNN